MSNTDPLKPDQEVQRRQALAKVYSLLLRLANEKEQAEREQAEQQQPEVNDKIQRELIKTSRRP